MAENRTDETGGRIRGIAPHSLIWVRASDTTDLPASKITINAVDFTAHAVVELDECGAALYAQQVLSAAGIDIVGRARKVVEAHNAWERGCTCDDLYPDEKPCMLCSEHRPHVEATAHALAAELAKLDGALR